MLLIGFLFFYDGERGSANKIFFAVPVNLGPIREWHHILFAMARWNKLIEMRKRRVNKLAFHHEYLHFTKRQRSIRRYTKPLMDWCGNNVELQHELHFYDSVKRTWDIDVQHDNKDFFDFSIFFLNRLPFSFLPQKVRGRSFAIAVLGFLSSQRRLASTSSTKSKIMSPFLSSSH